ncbi:IS982 family transposase [Cryomorpha ignava]|jgi:transposase|uniref:IS982 family transposase n=1 Tax=Cryomorpha ignava TaxID=101383 RepID=A0A7K3WXT2_9FLAO|nr:IS982 family transposase [Cryomorpha ignava]NEN25921.1 IS982 family transposase [Cryomorpha ignava]
MYFTEDKVTEIFYLTDEFCNEFEVVLKKGLIGNEPKRKPRMSQSEVMTILVIFHGMNFRNLKHFYQQYVQKQLKHLFPKTVSYNRFVELAQSASLPLAIFLKTCCLGESTGISFVDSTPVRVCKNKRIKRNKVFKDIATTGKSTMGWFHGFKLHLVVNDRGEILSFVITPANVDDRDPLKHGNFLANIKGKLYGDKGYVSSQLANILFVDGLHLITGIRNNMKNVLMEMKDKILLRKRSVIETINDELKNICQIEHSRHRSFGNFISNLLSGLIAYSFFQKKPAIKYEADFNTLPQLF